MGKELAVNNLANIIEQAVANPEIDPDKMMKLLDVHERVFNKNAEISFNQAMVKCQEEMPTVVRDASNDQTRSKYAKFETIISTIKPTYTKHGFSLSFGTDDAAEGHIRIVCDVMHSDGHSKRHHVDLPLDIAGIKGSVNKTGVHATASTHSYGKRYLVGMIFNIAQADQDDDGNSAGGLSIQMLLNNAAWVRELFPSIATIKTGIMMKEYSRAAEAWVEMTEEEKRAVWVAPTKGGIFTTIERQIIRSAEFKESYNQENEDAE